MKTKLIFLLLMAEISMSGYAAIWTITNSGTTFTPATITISQGDSVNFNLSSAHNALEVSQTTWNNNGNTAFSGGFQTPFGGGLVLPAQLGSGTHYYVCVPHASMGMKGIIIVQNCSAPAQPGPINGNASICSVSSNTYSITPVSGASSYTWILPDGWTGSSTTESITVVAGLTGGNITVKANNACGSSVIQTLSVTIFLIDTSVSQSGITLTSNAMSAEYQWINCITNMPVPGQTNQSFTATANGNYAVIVTQNGCSDTSSCYIISTIGIGKNEASAKIKIYPNPSNGIFTIEMGEMETGIIEIDNVMGEKIYQSALTNPEINLSNKPKGIYFVKIYAGNLTITKRILIQ